MCLAGILNREQPMEPAQRSYSMALHPGRLGATLAA